MRSINNTILRQALDDIHCEVTGGAPDGLDIQYGLKAIQHALEKLINENRSIATDATGNQVYVVWLQDVINLNESTKEE